MSAFLGRVTAPLALILITLVLGACASPDAVPAHRSTQAAPLPTTPAAAVASARVPALHELEGLRPAEILAMLGPPELKRDEAPAELWQYRTTDCVLNLFFYREAGGYRLSSAESWTRDSAASASPTPCRDVGAPVRAHLVSRQSAL